MRGILRYQKPAGNLFAYLIRWAPFARTGKRLIGSERADGLAPSSCP